MARGDKILNEYADRLGLVFDECPKAVIAAIAMSHYINLECDVPPPLAFCREWQALYDAGIVPQKPGKRARIELSALSKGPARSAK